MERRQVCRVRGQYEVGKTIATRAQHKQPGQTRGQGKLTQLVGIDPQRIQVAQTVWEGEVSEDEVKSQVDKKNVCQARGQHEIGKAVILEIKVV
jgi:hypothetical protein